MSFFHLLQGIGGQLFFAGNRESVCCLDQLHGVVNLSLVSFFLERNHAHRPRGRPRT